MRYKEITFSFPLFQVPKSQTSPDRSKRTLRSFVRCRIPPFDSSIRPFTYIRESMTCLAANKKDQGLKMVESIFDSLGDLYNTQFERFYFGCRRRAFSCCYGSLCLWNRILLSSDKSCSSRRNSSTLEAHRISDWLPFRRCHQIGCTNSERSCDSHSRKWKSSRRTSR